MSHRGAYQRNFRNILLGFTLLASCSTVAFSNPDTCGCGPEGKRIPVIFGDVTRSGSRRPPALAKNGETSFPLYRPGKEIILYRQHWPWWKTSLEAAALPFKTVGAGVYYVVQGPRMLAELIAFGNRGESFLRLDDTCPCPRGFALWRRHPFCPDEDACWVPPTH